MKKNWVSGRGPDTQFALSIRAVQRLLVGAARLGAVVSTGLLGSGSSSWAGATIGSSTTGSGSTAGSGVIGFEGSKVTAAGESQASEYDQDEGEFTHVEVLSE
jgi:hypothetical protein